MAQVVIFDLDGTLLDSVDLHAAAWQEAFREFGHEFAFDKIRSQIGKGGDQLLPVFLSESELKTQGGQLQEFRSRLFKRKYLAQVKPFPGVRDLFERVKRDGLKIAIASSAKGDELKVFERCAGIEDLVEVEASSADAERSKPHPDIFEAVLDRLGPGTDRNQVIVVGDTPHDAEAAGKAGLKTIGVLCGGFAESDLRDAGCIEIYEGPGDLLRRYDTSALAGVSAV